MAKGGGRGCLIGHFFGKSPFKSDFLSSIFLNEVGEGTKKSLRLLRGHGCDLKSLSVVSKNPRSLK